MGWGIFMKTITFNDKQEKPQRVLKDSASGWLCLMNWVLHWTEEGSESSVRLPTSLMTSRMGVVTPWLAKRGIPKLLSITVEESAPLTLCNRIWMILWSAQRKADTESWLIGKKGKLNSSKYIWMSYSRVNFGLGLARNSLIAPSEVSDGQKVCFSLLFHGCFWLN